MKKSLLASPIYNVETKTKKGDFKTGLLNKINKLVEKLCQTIFNDIQKASEPKITRYINSSGKLVWNVYDPTTYNTFVFNTEEEVNIWLESRYYSHARS